jgi:hypothetical protein
VPTWQDREEELEAEARHRHRKAAEIRMRAELSNMIEEIRQSLAAARGNTANALSDIDLAEQNMSALLLKVIPGTAMRDDGEVSHLPAHPPG